MAKTPQAIPKKPRKPAIKTNRTLRIMIDSSNSGTAKVQIAVNAMTITIVELTRPAFTAASPIIKAPTMLIAGPITRGSLIPDSLNISKKNIIKRVSSKVGKGISFIAPDIFTSRMVGIISW